MIHFSREIECIFKRDFEREQKGEGKERTRER